MGLKHRLVIMEKWNVTISNLVVLFLIGCMHVVPINANSRPIIDIRSPYFSTSEATEIGAVLTQLTAIDTDGDGITFEATSDVTTATVNIGPPNRNGTNRWTSDITLKTPLDVDDAPSRIYLYFDAFDDTNRSPIRLTMIITDVNDNPPSFTNLPYKTEVPEDTKVGKSLYQFTATDPDQGAGSGIIYSMEPNDKRETTIADYNETFQLDSALGIVKLKKLLNYEAQTFYHFNVYAKDEGNPQCPGPGCLCKDRPKDYCKGSVVDFFITVTDVEDTPPIFDRLSYTGRVAETKRVNFTILTTQAKNGDRAVDNPSPIRYSLSDENVPFSVDPDKGEVRVAEDLDADDGQKGPFVFNVTATEVTTNQSSSAKVSITVEDDNDNPPIFNAITFNGKVRENTPTGVPISVTPAIRVTDKDQDVNSQFRIIVQTMDGQPETRFSTIPGPDQTPQGSLNVTVTVNNATDLDYEKIKTISFKIIAREVIGTDLGDQSNESVVTINIEDTNDNSPTFLEDQQNAQFNVSESVQPGYVIHTFTAMDPDSGEFGTVEFSMENHEKFAMDAHGDLTVKSTLDREKQSSYFIVVTATDNPKAEVSQQRKTQLQVTVRITDANDKDPEWITTTTIYSVPETEQVNFVVARLRATDKDVGKNSELDYRVLQNTTGSDYFDVKANALDNNQAELYVKKSLIGVPGDYVVFVVAKDKGDDPRESILPVTVQVTDVNLDPPIFIKPNESLYNISTGNISEIWILETDGKSEPDDTVLYRLEAEDEGQVPDDGVAIYYSIVPSSNNDNKYFRVDPINGTITALMRLDREVKDTYEIQIKAVDRGLPLPLSKTLPLKIRLLDRNDSDPTYPGTEKPQVMNVTEENEGASIGIIKKAEDLDLIDQVCYYLCDRQESPALNLNKYDRNLSLVEKVDREKIDSFNVMVLASSQCDMNPPINCSKRTNAMLDIRVDVLDTDDNPPRFIRKEYSRSITSDKQINTEVVNLKNQVQDEDVSSFKQYEFRLLSTSRSPEMAASFSSNKDAFYITKSGSIKTNVLFLANMVGHFLLKVEVYGTERPDFKDNAEVKIYIVSDEQRVRLVFPNTPEYVMGVIDTLAKKLSNVLDLNITVGAIKTHIKSDNTQDSSKTDAFIYATKKGSDEIVPAIELQNALDFSNDARKILFSYKVQAAQGLSSKEEEDDDEMLTRLFIILMTVMGILVIALGLVLANIIRMYRRRLKAATTMAYVSPKQQEMYEHPGTNKYYTAENPLFGKEIKAPELEEDRNSTNSLDVNAVDQKSPAKTSQDNVDPEEEQEVVLQITDTSLSTPQHNGYPNQNMRLNKVLEEYEHSVQNGVKTKPPPPPPLPQLNGVGHTNQSSLPQSKVYAIPGLGQDVQEAVTRFSDDGSRPKNHGYPDTIHEIATNHGNLEYTEI